MSKAIYRKRCGIKKYSKYVIKVITALKSKVEERNKKIMEMLRKPCERKV